MPDPPLAGAFSEPTLSLRQSAARVAAPIRVGLRPELTSVAVTHSVVGRHRRTTEAVPALAASRTAETDERAPSCPRSRFATTETPLTTGRESNCTRSPALWRCGQPNSIGTRHSSCLDTADQQLEGPGRSGGDEIVPYLAELVGQRPLMRLHLYWSILAGAPTTRRVQGAVCIRSDKQQLC